MKTDNPVKAPNEHIEKFLNECNPFYGPAPETMEYHGLAGSEGCASLKPGRDTRNPPGSGVGQR